MVIGSFSRLVSTTPAASFNVSIADFTSGRSSHEGDQHLEIKLQRSSESHSLGSGGRPGRSPVTTLDMITPSLTPGKGCCPVITWTLPMVTVVEIKHLMLTWYVVTPNAYMSLFFVGLLCFRPKPEGFNSSGAMYLAVPTEGDTALPGSTVAGSDMIATSP